MDAVLTSEPVAPEADAGQSPLPPFLRLSREIRDLIYLAVLEAADEAPPSPSACGPRLDLGYYEAGRIGRDWPPDPCQYRKPPLDYGTWSEWNRYSESPVRINSRSLLYLNHQVHAEMTEAISRLRASDGLYYLLDCIIENEYVLWPTWLHVPAVSSKVDIVETQIRACGDWSERWRSGWRAGCGGYAHVIWSLLELLQRFLVRGPDFLSQPKESGPKIGVLVLNIITPEEPENGFLPVESHIGSGDGRKHGLIHPESMALMLTDHTDTLLQYACGGVSELKRKKYSVMKLVDYIDRIEIRVDGNERKSWELKEVLAFYTELEERARQRSLANQ
ncbi:hypothetical protein BKA64DRAFT_2082 [Cadophora sp. MPI-SDFR-AT-0126]|nr:hypothetical protein BKA64DRAFT_2082 [Leotiomycetes sp. MPI-SDFR-AT-0126]